VSQLLFEHPEWLAPAAVAVALAAAALAAALLTARRRLRALLGTRATPRWVGDAALLASLLLIAVALLGPRIGRRAVLTSASGTDLVILLDVSRSMNARDVPPSRLHRARAAAVETLQRLGPESRAALAAFSGRSALLTPLTPDTSALVEMVEALDSDLIRPGGSHLRLGVESALQAFEPGSDRPRVLLVLSDGELSESSAPVGDAAARRAQARVLAAALGSPLGATIPDRGALLRDARGEIVVTRRITSSLARLAEATGGRLFTADEWGQFDLDQAMREIERDSRPEGGEPVVRRLTVAVVLPFAALAFALLSLESLWGAAIPWLARRTRSASPARAGAQRGKAERSEGGSSEAEPSEGRAQARWRRLAAALPLVLLLGAGQRSPGVEVSGDPAPEHRIRQLEALARQRPLEPRELIELGLARAEIGEGEAGERAFRAAALTARDPGLAAIAYHNLGVSALARRELETARDRFFDALALRGDDRRTRFNLEWTLVALRGRPPQQTPLPAPDELARPRPDSAPSDAKPSPGERKGPATREAAGAEQSQSAELEAARRATDPLGPEQRRRWLDRIQDDTERALRVAARQRGEPKPSRRRNEPTW
jgi:Ca-activated chloride channel family protein